MQACDSSLSSALHSPMTSNTLISNAVEVFVLYVDKNRWLITSGSEEMSVCRRINLVWKISDLSFDRISTTCFAHTFTLSPYCAASEMGEHIKQDRQYTYNVTLWRVHVTIVAVGTQQCIFCVVEIHVTVNYIKILSVAQQCFYGKFISRPK
jgi:hypothetical protein